MSVMKLLVLAAVICVHSVPLKLRDPVQPNGHIIEVGQPDYSYVKGVEQPTFTNDEDPHTFKTVEGCDCGNGRPSVEEHGAPIDGSLLQTSDDKKDKQAPGDDRTFTDPGPSAPCNCPNHYTATSVEPSECAHCGGSKEGGFIQTETSKAKKDAPQDRDFVDPGPNGPIVYTSSAPPPYQQPSYTIDSVEPSECQHCGGSSEGKVFLQKDAKKDKQAPGDDRTFTDPGPSAPCNCPNHYTATSVEPSECQHCGSSSE